MPSKSRSRGSRTPSRSRSRRSASKRSKSRSQRKSSRRPSPHSKRSPRRSRAKRSSKKSPVRIPLTKGSLGMYGYEDVKHMSATERHKALGRALKHEDALAVFRKLNALYVMNKNKHPDTAAIFMADRDWVKSHYEI